MWEDPHRHWVSRVGDIAEGRDSHERESSKKYFDGGKSRDDA